MDLDELAREYLAARAAGKRADGLKAELVKAMGAAGVATVEVVGVAAVAYTPGSMRTTVDAKAAADRVVKLASDLEAACGVLALCAKDAEAAWDRLGNAMLLEEVATTDDSRAAFATLEAIHILARRILQNVAPVDHGIPLQVTPLAPSLRVVALPSAGA